MTEQYTNYANVRVEDIPPHGTFQFHPSWRFAWRSPVKYLSLNGKMEYHYILEWLMPMPSGECLIREEYFGDKIISTSYRYECGGITQVYYSDRAAYFMDEGGVRKEELKDNKVEPAQSEPVDEKLDEYAHLSTEGKLQLVKEKLKEFMSILDSTFVTDDKPTHADNEGTPIQYFGATPDKENSVNQWEVKMTDDKNQGRAIPFYIGDYLHAESLTGERVTVDGEEYLIMRDNLERRFRVTRKTQIAHLVDYVSITHYGSLIIGADWTVLYEDALVHGEDGEKTFLPVGTRFKVLDYAGVFNGGEINPGTLAVQYADYDYPTL